MMRKINAFAAALVAGILFAFTGCDNGSVAVEKVEITAEVTEVFVDSTIKLTATVSPADATDSAVTWSSDNEEVAKVDSNGVVTGVKAGKATITAKAGEKSATVEITVKILPLVSKIELSKNRFAYTEGGSTFTATVEGANFDLIESQDDKTVKVQIVDASNNVTDVEAIVDATNNKATATLTLPTLTSATSDGITYTVRAKICGNVDTEHTVAFNILAAEVTDITLETSQIFVGSVTSDTKTKARVSGKNLDFAGSITLSLYDSSDKQYGESVSVDTSSFTQNTTSFDVDLAIPTEIDTYTAKVLFANVAQSKTASLQVSMFASFKIPNAGISKKGNTVTATVTGKNFKAQDITSESFSLSCTDNSNIVKDSKITISSDSLLTVTLTIPETADSYEVTIASGKSSLTRTFTVKDYNSYAVGDVILKDGSKIDVTSVESTTFETSGDKVPVAVVAGFNANGAAIGLGLTRSKYVLSWCPSGTTGYDKEFTDIIGTTTSGDMDGSDNWEYICSEDPTGSADAATNYPAFNFAANYGTETCKFDAADELATGWYIPSIAELNTIYNDKTTIQTSLTKASGFTLAPSESMNFPYWSGSTYTEYKCNFSLGFDFTNGNSFSGGRQGMYYVLVVRAF